MECFPKSLISFQRMFPDEAACAAWLFSMRWPEGFHARVADTIMAGRFEPRRTPSNAPAAIARPR